MKIQTNSSLFTTISKTTVKNLTAVVKETLALDFTSQQHKTFSTADMWNIHRNGRTRIQRRYAL